MPEEIRYAGYPSAVVYDRPEEGRRAVQHLLWGDWLRCKEGRRDGFVEVRARGVDGWMEEGDVQEERLLEVVFVDIGQGDGALVVTPDDRCMVVDAGEGDNMFRFLRWRFGRFREPFEFHCAVITHPDADHYRGFDPLFEEPNVRFGTVYHNGLMEQRGDDPLGRTVRDGGVTWHTELIRDESDAAAFFADRGRWERKWFPSLVHGGLDRGSFRRYRMLSAADGHLPGFAPADGELHIEVLGPVAEPDAEGRLRLRSFGRTSYTKNGHSVVLRLVYRDVSVLLGGDLNIPAEEHLLAHHTGLPCPPESGEDREILVATARRIFGVDVAKVCHHGSADFSTLFLDALNPVASVISSGDDEPHSHPRADALGTLGRHSRGPRPLIFSTELARSAPEAIKHPHVLRRRLQELQQEIDRAPDGTPEERREKEKLEAEFEELVGSLDRSVAVYGAINLRTDGRRVVMAQKLERSRSPAKKWDIYRLEPQGHGGPLAYVSKH